MEEITKSEQEILFHTLGLNYKDEPFRNHFVAGVGHSDLPLLESLVKKGFIAEAENGISEYFYVTETGKSETLKLKKESMPKLTRSQRRYKLYLHCEVEETYGEWLKNRYWDDIRKRNHAS